MSIGSLNIFISSRSNAKDNASIAFAFVALVVVNPDPLLQIGHALTSQRVNDRRAHAVSFRVNHDGVIPVHPRHKPAYLKVVIYLIEPVERAHLFSVNIQNGDNGEVVDSSPNQRR